MKLVIYIVCGVLLLLLLIVLIVSAVITKMVVCPHRYTRKEQHEYNLKMNNEVGCECLQRTPIEFTMKDGYIIHGDYSLIKDSKKMCILVHGHGTSREGALRYSLLFHQLGFSTLIYDQRSHGDNIWKDVSMGVKESQDLNEIISQVYSKFGSDLYLGLQGTSMGGATVLLALKGDQKIQFVVSDCAYATFKSSLKDMIRHYHLPSFIFMPFVNLNLRLFHHWSLKDASPIEAVKKTDVPILFIHGDKDTFVATKNVNELYDSCHSIKQMWICKDAKHAGSIYTDPEEYKKQVESFLKEIN